MQKNTVYSFVSLSILLFVLLCPPALAGCDGTISVSSNPTYATIYLDGQKQGETSPQAPFDIISVPCGPHTLELTMDGYYPYTTQVYVDGKTTTKVTASLTVLPATAQPTYYPTTAPSGDTGTLVISTSPSGATIYLDNVVKGISPLTLYNVPSGTHTVTVKQAGYNDAVQQTTVSNGQSTDLSITLSPISTASSPGLMPLTIFAGIVCCAVLLLKKRSG